MTSGSKQKPKARSSGIRSPNHAVGKVQSLVPPLPIHMIGNSNVDSGAAKPKKPQPAQQQNSARSAHSKPPPPESYRSHRSNQNRQQPHGTQQHLNSGRSQGGGASRRSAQRSQFSQANSSQQNITGAIVNGALVNNVMLQGNNKVATSKFEKGLEADFEGDDATLLFDTERLKQFPEDYACLEAMESTDQRILVKQWLFMKHERELKKQAQKEKAVKEQRRQEKRAKDRASGGGNNGAAGAKNRRHSQGTASGFNIKEGLESGESLDISAIQLESSLSQLGTIDRLKVKNDKNLEAQLSEMLKVSECGNMSGLKTVTQKELVLFAERNWQQQEQVQKERRNERRKVLDKLSSGDDDEAKSETHEKILAGLEVDEPRQPIESVPISPSGIKMQLPTRSD